ncbi:hypothetical protein Lfu02_58970 [Longispora fulva]|uniref:Branched-subunit amino acid ABC-type transport system permease component n=1 Tax=Longispora fulva TaxID=619741 RepID=A0A8J7KKT7_9ACTN|nr:hypothetical protein [Longispora fulva]MBG6137121.1 branched-subunit amino acid ABC-type transport system permease component [Longispora fulva]GIG61525.1 hypothetical protein Lfu02_58970 [Longispora fulva]
MSSEERRAWIMVLVTTCAYAIYATLILRRAGDAPLADTPYAATLLWTIGGAIVASIVLHILFGGVVPKGARRTDERDKEINRLGEHIGSSFVILGGVTAMGMAMLKWDHFWIANVIYLAFVLSSLLGSTAKIVAYRRGFQSW